MPFVRSAGAIVDANRASTLTAPRAMGINTYGGLVRAYEAIYATQPNVRTVVDFLGKNIAGLTLRLMRRVSADERREEYDHGLARLMRLPNPTMSRFMFFRELVEDLGIYDVFIGVKADVSGRRVILRIPPQYVEPIGDNWLTPEAFRILGSKSRPEIPRANVVFIRGYNPSNARWGLSPIETLRRILAEDEAAGEYREQLWARGARPSGFITRPVDAPNWSDRARERFLASFNALYASDGPSAGGTGILEEGMTYSRDGFSAEEAQYIEARKLTREEVAVAYHLDPSNLGISSGAATEAGADAAHRRLYQDNFGPTLRWIGEELTLQTILDYEDSLDALDELGLEFDIEEKVRGDFATEAEAASRAVGAPWRTRNEQRARMGLPAIDGGDELITPLNVVVGGRANPTDTAPGTPGAGQLHRPRGRRRRELTAGKAADDDDTHGGTDLEPWVGQHVDVMLDFVGRQRRSVLSRLGRGDDPATALGRSDNDRFPRWDTELANLLGGLALAVAPVAAAPVAEMLGVDYDLDNATPWLLNNARIAAETFNDITYHDLADIYPAATSSRSRPAKADDDTPPAPTYSDVFDHAETRAETFASDRVSTVSTFAAQDAANAANARSKTWRTHSRRPRASHAALNGVTIGAAERFSNGGLWPHDPALSSDESAGCTCTVEFSDAEPPEAGRFPDDGDVRDGALARPEDSNVAALARRADPNVFAGELTEEEAQALKDYATGGYRDLNAALRAGTDLEDLDDASRALAEHLDAALAKAPKSDPIVVYRGVDPGWRPPLGTRDDAAVRAGLADFTESRFAAGDIVTLRGYQSTSLFTQPALDASLTRETPGIIFEIRTRSTAYLSPDLGTAHYADEAEVLLPRDSRFRVVKVLRDVDFLDTDLEIRRRTVVQLEEL